MKKGIQISKLAVSLRWSPETVIRVGTLYRSPTSRTIHFEYDQAFVQNRISLSPFHLPLRSGAMHAETDEHSFFGLHGVFADSLPDGWGLLVMAQSKRRMGLRFDEATALDKLAFIGTKGFGALVYEPTLDASNEASFALNLATLSDDAHRVLEGNSDEVLSELLLLGGFPGGARPKIVAAIKPMEPQNDFYHGPIISGHTETTAEGFEPWLIKFGSKEDDQEAALTEFLYAQTARHVGIEVEPTALFKDSKERIWFGMRRFDRLSNHQRRLSQPGRPRQEFLLPHGRSRRVEACAGL
jgi:serine/threonine-protein kinase HipA